MPSRDIVVPMGIGRLLIGLVGLFDAAAGAALLLTPRWFYDTLATFPPFNRHYAGDVGAFLLPIGVGLLVAALDPIRYRAVLVLALVASWIHAANHALDGLQQAGEGSASLLDAANIIGMATALSVGIALTWQSRRPS